MDTRTTGTAEGIRLADTLPNGRHTIRGYVAANCDGATSGRGLGRLSSTTKADRQGNASPAGRGLFASTGAGPGTAYRRCISRVFLYAKFGAFVYGLGWGHFK